MTSKFYTGTSCGGAFRDVFNLSLPSPDVHIYANPTATDY